MFFFLFKVFEFVEQRCALVCDFVSALVDSRYQSMGGRGNDLWSSWACCTSFNVVIREENMKFRDFAISKYTRKLNQWGTEVKGLWLCANSNLLRATKRNKFLFWGGGTFERYDDTNNVTFVWLSFILQPWIIEIVTVSARVLFWLGGVCSSFSARECPTIGQCFCASKTFSFFSVVVVIFQKKKERLGVSVRMGSSRFPISPYIYFFLRWQFSCVGVHLLFFPPQFLVAPVFFPLFYLEIFYGYSLLTSASKSSLSRVQGCCNLGGSYDSSFLYLARKKYEIHLRFSFFLFCVCVCVCVNRHGGFESRRRETWSSSSRSWHDRLALFKRGRRNSARRRDVGKAVDNIVRHSFHTGARGFMAVWRTFVPAGH